MSDLMKKRYKLTLLYPWCPWEIGEILSPDEMGELYGKYAGYPASKWKVFEHEAISMPLIFQPLPWYAERELSEMPEYVKHTPTGIVFMARWLGAGHFELLEVPDGDKSTPTGNCGCTRWSSKYWPKSELWHFVPATESEYLIYTSHLTKNGKK